ncbi:MAG: glutamate 5-kinase [Candidatus Omnitrophica bacterium]|nr:glutamate 5-kinase [Candidatus Omnitrophota bacterium]
MKKSANNSQKIVIKVGSSLLTGGGSLIVPEDLEKIVRGISGLVREGKKVILVTSGAVASGLSVLGFKKRPTALAELQAAAAAGQNILMQAYASEFAKHGLKCAQILITREDFHDRQRYLNARGTINTLLRHGVIPVINENDAVSTEEIKFGDNDTLSARVAAAVEADGLLILSDIDGLYERFDKSSGTGSHLLKEVAAITPEIERLACGTDKMGCVGGMSTKIVAARIATNAGIPVILAHGLKSPLRAGFAPEEEHDGTRFSVANFTGAKKHWIAFEAQVKGRIIVDEGARAALTTQGRSLLAPGVKGVEGDFKAGQAVDICDIKGVCFARGKVNFSSTELNEIKQAKGKKEVVHRDDLAILD